MFVVLDFETASASDLRKEGAWKYAEDPTTEILCLGYSVDGTKPVLITPDILHYGAREFIIGYLEYCVVDPACIFIAHNAGFEKAIWRKIMVAQYGWPDIPNSRWHDSLAVCAMKAIPMKLERAAMALRLHEQTGKGHQRIVMAPSRPKKDGSYDRSPELLEAVYAENRQDVRAEVELNHRIGGLQSCERPVWLLDQRINERGVLVDLDFVAACQKIIDGATPPLVREFEDITGGIAPTRRAAVLEWIGTQGVELPNLQKGTIDALLGGSDEEDDDGDEDFSETPLPELPAPVRRALEIRRRVGSASVKKLGAIRNSACADGRVRGIVQYHGAGPGRWVGRLFQPQNFPRGSLKFDRGTAAESVPDVELVYQALSTGDWQYVEGIFGDCFEAVISGLRHAIIAGRDRVLNVGDFATIEARIVLAIAGAEKALEILQDKNRDVYCEMAGSIFRMVPPYGKEQILTWKTVHLAERQTGKNTILGCFGADALVLTRRGYIPIVDIETTDQLWDGIEWVNHSGVVNQGQQETIALMGVEVTPDHLVLARDQWLRAGSVVQSKRARGRVLETGSASLPLQALSMALAAEWSLPWRSVRAARNLTGLSNDTSMLATVRAARAAPRSRRDAAENGSSDMLLLFPMKLTASACSIELALAYSGVTTQNVASFTTTADEGFLYLSRGERTENLFSRIFSRLKGGISHTWNLIEQIATRGMNRGTSGLSHAQSMPATGGKSPKCNNASSILRPVYDIANAGPRNRFTILTLLGPIIVHNCGFQMGGKTFRARYCPDQPEEFAQNAVAAYREAFAPEVPKLWYALEEAALRAVWDRRPTEAYGLEFRWEDIWLTMRLHSGRKLYYAYPEPCKKAMPWDETDIRPAWTCKAQKNGRFITRDMYGGLLTENAVQAEARDLLVAGMFKAEKNNMPIVLTVHDEIVAEPLQEHSNHEMLGQLMTDRPQWAIDLRIPVAAETWSGGRYKK